MEQAVQLQETTGMQPSNSPQFQINLYKANDRVTQVTYLVMIQRDKDNIGILTKSLQKASKDNELGTFQWRDYTRLSAADKDSCLYQIRMCNALYKSITVKGFNDNKDNVPMRIGDYNQVSTTKNSLTDISVSDYLRQITHQLNN
jgi:hypothetical protein